ncbi:MAG: hypothetical protein MK193_14955 [Lentisphaeria bacterium]|nr:hypothetical protein [Lentisphaeria bacterium]
MNFSRMVDYSGCSEKKEPLSSGLPIVYLDHNILDAFLDNKLIQLKEALTNRFQVVYSNETLNEIKRAGKASPKYSEAFLDLLNQINAAHMSIVLDDKFHETNQIRIVEGDPHTFFHQFCNSEPVFNNLTESMHQFGFKVSGGRQGESLEDVQKIGVEAFESLMDYLEENIREIEEQIPEVAQQLRAEKSRYLQEYKELSKQNTQNMAKHITDEKNWSGIKDFRQHFKLEPYHFNSISAPNILQQIWRVMKKSQNMPKEIDSIDDFFMFNKQELMPGQPFLRHNKVLGAYNLLNTIGYYPDKPLHKDRGFKRSTSDQMHVSLASFCNCLITRDERLWKKAEAIYEYLNIPTEIIYFDKAV